MSELDPRVVRTRSAVLRAAAEVLLTEGWDQVTHSRVARAAGFARATVYNHWPRRADLLRGAFEHIGAVEHASATGDLRADLVEELEVYRRVLIDGQLAGGLIALADRASSDPEIAELRTQWLEHGQSVTLSLLTAARDRGELHADLDVGAVADLLSGGLTYRVAVMAQTADRGFVETLVDSLLDGIRVRRA